MVLVLLHARNDIQWIRRVHSTSFWMDGDDINVNKARACAQYVNNPMLRSAHVQSSLHKTTFIPQAHRLLYYMYNSISCTMYTITQYTCAMLRSYPICICVCFLFFDVHFGLVAGRDKWIPTSVSKRYVFVIFLILIGTSLPPRISMTYSYICICRAKPMHAGEICSGHSTLAFCSSSSQSVFIFY